MKTTRGGFLFRAIFVACGLFWAVRAPAQLPPGFTGPPTNKPIASWSFQNQTNWASDQGYLPISFTNLNYSPLGDGSSLVVATNLRAWLNYNVVEPSTGATNLVLNAPGSLAFWYAPADWSSSSAGGTGPAEWVQLIDVGELTTNAAYGYWGLSVDPAGSNLWFVAQDSAGDAYALSTPISWTTNYFHFVALTYSITNVAIYLDGRLATNATGGLSIWPGSEEISSGVFFGSDMNGQMAAQGLFNTVQAYNYPLSSNSVQAIFDWYDEYYLISPFNIAMSVASAPSVPSTNYYYYDIITGPGNLQQVGSVSPISSSNVWITNVVASTVGSGTNNMRLEFTIQGGFAGVPYDIFANSILDFSTNTNRSWSWQGQGYQGNTYIITNLPNTACFLILGTPQSTAIDGLTDAYKLLVLKTNPDTACTSGDGIADSDKILEGLNVFGYYPQWKLDADDDSLPDEYETLVGLNPNSPEAPPGLPSYNPAPIQ